MALDKKVFDFLKKYNTDTQLINSLIVSNFIYTRNVYKVKNTHINNLIISKGNLHYDILQNFINVKHLNDFEDLIEAFEFVISPSDKIINGAIYTPNHIREYIVQNCIEQSNLNICDLKISDISCGCGGFLLTALRHLKNNTNTTYEKIFSKNIYGLDIENYSVERTKILLTLEAIVNGEDKSSFKFNIHTGNSLVFDWRAKCKEICLTNGFDIIVGNPPYVSSRNMTSETLELLKNIEVSSSGHPDLYIPFFQIGIENLNPKGVLGYITVNTFLKSINGRALRAYFSNNNIDLTILNFGGEQLFKDRNTYTCICFISFKEPQIKYRRLKSKNLLDKNLNLAIYSYQNLNNESGWNLVNKSSLNDFLKKIESTGIPFGQKYVTRNGIATLKNNVYKFTPIKEDDKFYYLNDKGIAYPIEKDICRNIVNANKLKKEADLKLLEEKIIFPYDTNSQIISEENLEKNFPQTLIYLKSKKEILKKRDKEKKQYEAWYAYGRRQSLDINKFKLFFPHICQRPNFVLCEEKDLLFYNGLAVISNDIEELKVLKKILESDLFYKYIRSTTKDYASGYISLSKNYIKNFGIISLNTQNKKEILNTVNINKFLADKYQVSLQFDSSDFD